MASKKYYWLKLKDDFFDDDTISFIEEQENGVYYVNFYLKLCLKSIKTNGKLVRLIGETLIPYDIKSLAKLTSTPPDTVRVAMKLFQDIGLVKLLDSGEIYLSQIDEMIGSETDKARLMRESRARKAIGNNVTAALPQCYTEIDKEKETEIDTDTEKESISAKPKRNRAEYPELFERFWKAYPKKVAKGTAAKAFKKAKVDESLLQDILKALEWQRETKQWKAEGGQYIPNPATYLNGRRWEDEQEGQPNGTNDISGTCEYKLDVLRL